MTVSYSIFTSAACVLDHSPFSHARHWLSLSLREEGAKLILYLKTSRGGVPQRKLISLAFSDSAAPEVLQEKLTLAAAHGGAGFALDGENMQRLPLSALKSATTRNDFLPA